MTPTFAAIAKRLTIPQPPSLNAIANLFDFSVTEFIELVKEYLPEYEKKIMRLSGQETRVTEFVHLFSSKYFELAEFDFSDEGYRMLCAGIPLILQGNNYDDYEQIDNSSAEWTCLTALVAYPFYVNEGGDGSKDRVPVLAAALPLAGETVRRIPAAGFKPAFLHEKLDHTKYEAVARFADWIFGDTGIWKLDYNYEEEPCIDWDKANVEELTRQEKLYVEFWEKINALQVWLKKDLKAHFAELVNAIMGRASRKNNYDYPYIIRK